MSDVVREALRCPVCLELAAAVSSCCTNGHWTCDECTHTMSRMSPAGGPPPPCPVCRAPPARRGPAWTAAVQGPPPAAIRKLVEFASSVRVACAHRRHGCTELVRVQVAHEHELHCPHAPLVRCMVARCYWSGAYDEAFQHVSADHPCSAYDVKVTTAARLRRPLITIRFNIPPCLFQLAGDENLRRAFPASLYFRKHNRLCAPE